MIKRDVVDFWDVFDERRGIRLFGHIKSHEVSLGFDNLGYRALFVDLPQIKKNYEPVYKLENISLTVQEGQQRYLILSLKDEAFLQVFNEFLFTILNDVEYEKDLESIITKIVRQYHIWSHFFSREKQKKIKLNKVLGIAGELFYLNQFLDDGIDASELIEAWEGPSNRTHDFIFSDFNLEVKAKLLSSNVVHISSLFQLDYDKYLKLGVVSFTTWQDDDEFPFCTLGLMISSIAEKLRNVGVDQMLFLSKLMQLGINYFDNEHMVEINEFRFIIHGSEEYHASDENFPRLVNSNVHSAIKKVKYDLDLNLIDDFKV